MPKKTTLTGGKAKKSKNRLLVHRKSNQFRDFVRLLRESHERVAKKQEPVAELVQS